MPTTIAIICTLDELIPYSLADPTKRYFSVNVSVALRDGPGLPQAAAMNVFQPWNLTAISPVVYVDTATPGNAGTIVSSTPVGPPRVDISLIANRLQNRYNAAIAAQNTGCFDWTDEPGANKPAAPGENWSRLLAHASTYLAPVPQSLNLSFVFAVDVHLLNGQKRLFAAPRIIDGANVYNLSTAPGISATGNMEWTYATSPTGYAMAAYQPEFALVTLPDPANLPAPHFIDPNTYLIGTESGADQTNPPESQASEDWRTALEHHAGEAFDLGQRLLVVLRKRFFPAQNPTPSVPYTPSDPYKPIDQTHPTFAEVDLMRDAILAALRDTADFGLRYAPDGTNLLRFVFQRANPPIDPGPFEKALKNVETSAANPAPALSDWKSLLAGPGLGINATLPPSISRGQNTDPADGAYVKATLDMLDSVQTALATDSTLFQILYNQWDRYLAPVQPPIWTASVQQTVNAALTKLTSSRTLRKRMLLANMGGQFPLDPGVPIWSALTTTPFTGYANETLAVSTNLQALLPGYFHGRFGITVQDNYSSLFAKRLPLALWPGGAGTPNPDVVAALSTDAKNFADTILFPAPSNQRTRASHPVIIQIGDTTDQPGVGLTDDLERKISGVGLLVREESAAWTCADFANLYVLNPQSVNPDKFVKLVENLPVPIRVVTRNKLKQPILAYNSASLVTQDDTDPVSQAFAQAGTSYPAAASPDWDQMFQFRLDPDIAGTIQTGTNATGNSTLTIPAYTPPGDTRGDWKRIPVTKVGLSYSFVPFVIGNGGTLPPLLASLADPFTPVNPSVFAANWATATTPSGPSLRPALTGYLRTIKYLRRVAVGAPRMKLADTSAGTQDNFPAIPASVVPLSRDFMGNASVTPLLLLYNTKSASPATSSFSFQLRLPSCDLETWDRWVAGLGGNYRNTRISVATGVGLFSPKSASDPAPPDLSIDDPAVSSLTFSMTLVYPPPAPGTNPVIPSPQTILIPPVQPIGPVITGSPDIKVGTLMNPAQNSGVKVSCTIANPVSLNKAGNSVTITVPEGQIWQISVQADVTPTDAQKFEGPAAVSPGGNFSFLIEAATPGVFGPNSDAVQLIQFQENLWNNLAVTFDSTQLNVSLTPWGNRSQADVSRDLMRNVDLRRQAWRWTGRPIAPLPDDWKTAFTPSAAQLVDAAPPSTDGNPLCSRVWELGSFAERSDDDSAINQTAINFASPNTFAALNTTPAASLHSSDLSTDPRAQYYRFGVDVHSRYEGLAGFSVAPVRAQKNVAAGGGYTRWRRRIIAPRVTGDIPKPKILLVIPLTEPSSPGSLLPDLLVIANEPCFTIGGLAEELHAQLDLARDPSIPLSVPTGNANPMPEIGPNPILSTNNLDVSHVTFSGSAIPAEPIGTTFDQDTSAPLFGNTCFRLKSSMLFSSATGYTGALPADGLEHFEAKIRFTRFLNVVPFTPVPWNPASGSAPASLESAPTDPFYVEFQSSFVHVATAASSSVPIDRLSFAIVGGVLAFTSNNAGVNMPVVPQGGPPQTARLEVWALIMRTITDVTGAPQTYALDILGPRFATTIPDSNDIVVYLLEVLCAPGNEGKFSGGIANATNFLFPDPLGANPDARARINRCSPQITHQ